METRTDDSPAAAAASPPSSIVCRDPNFSLYPCPMLRSGTVTSAHRIAHGAFGGASNIPVRNVVQPVNLGVECPCALCCPCEEHRAMRAEIEAEAQPLAEAEDKQRSDAVRTLLTADAPAEDASDSSSQPSKRSKTSSGKNRRKTTGPAAAAAAASAAASASAPSPSPSSLPWTPDSPLFAWLTPEAALALAAWDPRTMAGAPHRPLLDEKLGTPPEYDPIFAVHRRPLGSGTFSTVWSVRLKFPPRELPVNASAADRATHAYLNGALAIKRFRPITASRIDSELEIAWRFGLMSPHIPPLLSILRLPGYPVSMVMPQCRHQSFHEIVAPRARWPRRFQRMTLRQIQAYMRGLLHALSVLHSFNIIHRDVKPDNYLFDFEAQAGGHTGWLVDFGLAHTSSLPHADLRCQQPERSVAVPMEEEAGEDSENTSEQQLQSPTTQSAQQEGAQAAAAEDSAAAAAASTDRSSSRKKRSRSATSAAAAAAAAAALDPALSASLSALSSAAGGAPHVLHRRPRGPEGGTRGYRAPEVLVASLSQGVGVDVWAAGAMLLEIMSRRSPFFQGEKTTGLAEVMALRGVRELSLPGIGVKSEGWSPEDPAWTLGEFCEYSSGGVQWPAEMQQLLDALLQLDPAQRISAKAALALPFFQIDFSTPQYAGVTEDADSAASVAAASAGAAAPAAAAEADNRVQASLAASVASPAPTDSTAALVADPPLHDVPQPMDLESAPDASSNAPASAAAADAAAAAASADPERQRPPSEDGESKWSQEAETSFAPDPNEEPRNSSAEANAQDMEFVDAE